MATKKIKPESFIGVELEWAEEQLATWKKYVSDNPFENMEDRVVFKQTAQGGQIPIIASTIESQQKNVRDTMKDYLSLLSAVDELRQREEKKQKMRKGFENKDVLDDDN